MLPPQLGHYRLLDKLGEGGMGVVYKAVDTHLDRPVAIKILPPHKVADVERKRRFVQEAKAASALNHPNIVTIHDINSDQGVDFIVMELIDGKTLDELIPRHGMRIPELLRIAVQIAEGLTAAHGAGITHRDIKPSNIMVTGAGHVKILDFGLAKLTDRSEAAPEDKTVVAPPRTAEGAILGTVCYMSPEQAEGVKVDARSDIFSFGAVLYEMTSGQRAFQGDTPASTLGAVIHKEPKPLSESGQVAPLELERLIARCLRKDRTRRFQGMADIKVALLDLKEESDSGRLPASADAPRARRGWKAPLALAAALVVGTGLWIGRARQPAIPREPVLTQITRDSAVTFQPALSADGKLLAYASDRADGTNLDIWVQQMAGGQPVRLTRHPAADFNPQFSPDGATIYFLSERAEGSVWAIPTLGGDERVLTKEVAHFPLLLSPDGRWLAHKRGSVQGEASPAFLLSTSGGGSRKVETSIQTFFPDTWSPDSRTLIGRGNTAIVGVATGDYHLYAVPAQGGEAIPITTIAGTKVNGSGVGVLGNRFFIGGQGTIDEYLLSGSWRLQGPVHRWALFPGTFLQFVVSDRVIVAASMNWIADIWSIAMDANRGKITGTPERLTKDEASDQGPSLSADGRKLIYTSDRHGNRDVWLRDMATGKETQVTATPESERRGQISPAGEKVAYELEGKEPSIFVREIAGGEPKLVCRNCNRPGWTPDSARVVYWDGLPIRFHTFDPTTGERRKLVSHPTGTIWRAQFSPDGKWIVFDLFDGSGRVQISIAGVRNFEAAPPSEWITVFAGDRSNIHAGWSPDGNLLYLFDRNYSALFAQSLDPVSKRPRGKPFHVFTPEAGLRFSPNNVIGMSMVRDRLVLSMGQSKSNLWKIELPGLTP